MERNRGIERQSFQLHVRRARLYFNLGYIHTHAPGTFFQGYVKAMCLDMIEITTYEMRLASQGQQFPCSIAGVQLFLQ